MNGIGCGIIGREVRRDIAIDDVGPIVNPQRFELLHENLVSPHLFLGKFYRVKAKRKAAAEGGHGDSEEQESDHGFNQGETKLTSRNRCEPFPQGADMGECSRELQANSFYSRNAPSAMNAETYISLCELRAATLPAAGQGEIGGKSGEFAGSSCLVFGRERTITGSGPAPGGIDWTDWSNESDGPSSKGLRRAGSREC